MQLVLKMKGSDWELVRYLFSWLVLPLSVLTFMVIMYWLKLATNFPHYFSCIARVKLLQVTEMPSLNRNENITCEQSGTRTTRLNPMHKKVFCSEINLYPVSQLILKIWAGVKNHIAKKHSKWTARVVLKCKLCDKEFHSFYLLREH